MQEKSGKRKSNEENQSLQLPEDVDTFDEGNLLEDLGWGTPALALGESTFIAACSSV